MRLAAAVAIVLFLRAPLFAHRLDEYLQATLISVEKNSIQAEIRLTPGVAVLPIVLAQIDTDANGLLSEVEQRAYAQRVLRDLSLSMGGERLRPRLISMKFPEIEELNEGRGEIQFEFNADLPPGGANRTLIFENRHQSRIAAYLVNCLAPRDPDIRIKAQKRNYTQSFYELDYAEAGVRSNFLSWWSGGRAWLSSLALLLCTRLAFLSRQRA